MTPEQHINGIVEDFKSEATRKYFKGQAEHGGNLWEKPGMIDSAIEEALDLYIYLHTLRSQRDSQNEGKEIHNPQVHNG